MSGSDDIVVLRTRGSSYVGLCGVWAALACYGVYRQWPHGWSESLKSTTIPLALAFLSAAWLAAFRLTLTPEALTYRRLFRKTRTIRFDEIGKIRRGTGPDKYSDGNGMDRLIVWSKNDKKKPFMVINLVVFSNENMKCLFERLEPYS